MRKFEVLITRRSNEFTSLKSFDGTSDVGQSPSTIMLHLSRRKHVSDLGLLRYNTNTAAGEHGSILQRFGTGGSYQDLM